ncbi:hypothetical protein [Kribbella sp.]|uniref:hypothetical protein n=1 Tax=Kribbella sp. TaxID=1871183 RepID=UPI002D4F3CA3|nr:hypothetical protein [Kribbella sp.]HZX04754.1 hypothetical protein [Kribbella sp.]
MPDSGAIVTSILAAAQLTVSDDELATFVKDYPLIRQAADALYLPELAPDEPAIRFHPLDFYPGAATAPAGKDA